MNKFESEPQIGVGKIIDKRPIIGYGDGSGLINWLFNCNNVLIEEDRINTSPYIEMSVLYLRSLTKIEFVRIPLIAHTLIDNETFNYKEVIQLENYPEIFHPSELLDKLKEFDFREI